jgi:hypothetical protein
MDTVTGNLELLTAYEGASMHEVLAWLMRDEPEVKSLLQGARRIEHRS